MPANYVTLQVVEEFNEDHCGMWSIESALCIFPYFIGFHSRTFALCYRTRMYEKCPRFQLRNTVYYPSSHQLSGNECVALLNSLCKVGSRWCM